MNISAFIVFLSWILMKIRPTHAQTEGLRLLTTRKEMSLKGLYSIPVLLALCHLFYEVTAQQCNEQKGGKSILGMMLQRHIFKRITGATLGNVCLQECYRDVRCQSLNFVISQEMCELNNRTKEARPEDFVADPERYYFTRDWKRVMLGSIPELPAETCKEIKASQEGQAVSGQYWFDSIIPGETILAHCDMEKEACKFDFEDGIDDWTKSGTAFNNQPTYGDNILARGRPEPANQQGIWWIGSFENRSSKSAQAGGTQGNFPKGTLTSPYFTITGHNISFLIGGGCDINTIRVELIIDNKVVYKDTGECSDAMTSKSWDVGAFVGQRARVKLVDSSSSVWGHINFDDLRGDMSCGPN